MDGLRKTGLVLTSVQIQAHSLLMAIGPLPSSCCLGFALYCDVDATYARTHPHMRARTLTLCPFLLSLCRNLSLYLSLSYSLSLSLSLYRSLPFSLSISQTLYIYIYICIYTCAYIYVHIYIYMFLFTLLKLPLPSACMPSQ